MSEDSSDLVVQARAVRKTFHRETGETVVALDDVNLDVRGGTLAALVGPDGAGKTTLMRLIAGLMPADSGQIRVLGVDAAADPQQIQSRIGYMPQKFGLYEDLTAGENLNLYADLHGVPKQQRQERFAELMAMTALGPFMDRLAGRLSGGMKQKLGLACTLVRRPELLLLDEPTVGVDPLSRRELWKIIRQLVEVQGLTVLMSSSYMDEAENCQHVLLLNNGKVLAHGRPDQVSEAAAGRVFRVVPPAGKNVRLLQARLLGEPSVVDAVPEGGLVRVVRADVAGGGAVDLSGVDAANITPARPRFEDGFMVLLRKAGGEAHPADGGDIDHTARQSDQTDMVVVHDLVRRFGTFTAVDHVSFGVHRGEIFGLLGPNGAGKTTTFRMLCGLLPASGGTLSVAGVDVRHARASARQRLGYVAQKFSLYGQLTVTENLEFFASAYGLRGRRKSERIDWALEQFELGDMARLPSGQLPGGYKQRLSMAAALLHGPDILFLDEPTSGADPLARRDFWRKITGLAERGVTIIVTTHMMEEAEYCDRVAIMDSGRILAEGTPQELRRRGEAVAGAEATMEDAFIAIVEKARGAAAQAGPSPNPAETIGGQGEGVNGAAGGGRAVSVHDRYSAGGIWGSVRRIWALVKKEGREVLRDPSSMGIGIVLPVMLILLFGFGLSLDVMHVPVAVVMEDRSPGAAELAAGFGLSPYFQVHMVPTMAEAQEMMLRRDVDGIVRIRPDFSRTAAMGDAQVQVLVHGTDANTARIIQTYAQGAVGQWAARRDAQGMAAVAGPVGVQGRMWFNEAAESRYFLVPGLIVLIMTLIGALLTALVMAREWERGTFEALFVTPVRAEEILLGKTIPYFVLGMIGLALCLGAARFLFHVPFRGSVLALVGTSVLYLLVALSIGLLISSTFKSQFVASQITLLVTFLPAVMLSGFMFDLRSMPMAVRALTYVLPARYYVALLQTIFLAGDVWGVILPNAAMLALMAAVLMLLARGVTHKSLA